MDGTFTSNDGNASRVDPGSAGAFGVKWLALHDAASAIAAVAGAPRTALCARVQDFPSQVQEAGGWRRRLAEQGIDDLSALMTPGVAALLSAIERGTDASSAAQALWREFEAARDAMLGFVQGDQGNRGEYASPS